MSRSIFLLQMAPEITVEVTATSVTSAIAAATLALPHLGATEQERSQALSYDNGIAYTLTCLLCNQVNPLISNRTPLEAMQEHLMNEHDLALEELINATSVFQGTPLAGCYIWGSPAHGACFRGSRYADTEYSPASSHPQHCFTTESLLPQFRLTQVLALRLLEGDSAEVKVQLAGADENAWYGFLPTFSTSSLLIWPRNRWTSESR